jgi:acyl-CoA reductase-like NAD-dependent aldehyde dehydrogenase
MATQEFKMLINGKLVGSSATFDVINPSTGKVFAQAPECAPSLLNEAISSAKVAFKKWRLTSFEERSACLKKAMGKVQAAIPNTANVLTKEQGKPLTSAMGEMGGILFFLDHFSKLEVKDTVLIDNDKETVIEKHVPLGVVGGITPWNFPPLMAAWKLAEAVMTGNTIVLKPSPYTPLSTLMLSEAFVDTFPPGVVNVVSGNDALGAMITSHPDVAKISFTGSTRTGKVIQAATSGTLKRLTLELGGNDPAIVLKGADVKAAAQGIFSGAMANTGQVCVAIKRAYVPASMHDEFVKELTAAAAKAKVGDGFEKDVQYGPIQNKMQYDRVVELVEDAKKAGAKVHAGGSPMAGPGYFYPLTILSNVKEGVRIVDEEQFGPVLPVIPYNDEDDVVDRANSTCYGLGGSVWGPSKEAAEMATKIDSGSVWVNHHANLTPDVPFGGRKESGVGRQMGAGTLEGYTDTKIIRIPKQSKL